MKNEHRFDVIFDEKGCHMDYHFCREWDENGGCYGTNKDHGFTFDEAVKEVCEFYKTQLKYWKKLTYDEWCTANGYRPD